MCALRPGNAALIGGGAEGVIRRVEGGATGLQGVRQAWAAVVSEWTHLGISIDQVACHGVTSIVLYQVMSPGGQNDRAGPVVTGIPAIAGDDRVGQLQAGFGRVEGTNEDRGGRPIWPGVIGDRRIENLHRAIGVENRAAMPACGAVTAKGAIGNVHVPERADRTTDVIGHIAANRAADDIGRGIEERVDAATRPGRMVVRHAAVNQVERSAITTIDRAAALPPIPSVGCHIVLREGDMVQSQRAVIENATGQLPAEALGNSHILEHRSRARVDDEDAIRIVPANRQTRRGRTINGHVLAEGQWTR